MGGMFRVTFDIVTHESAEHGDVESRGFIMPGEWKVDVDSAEDYAAVTMTLREAMRLVSPIHDCGRWFSDEGTRDYITGDVETRSIHPPHNVTPSSYARLRRIILGKR